MRLLLPLLWKSGSSTSIGVISHLKLISYEPQVQNAHKNLDKKKLQAVLLKKRQTNATHSGQVSFASALKAMEKAMFVVMAVFIY